ncbi:hypothetical protein MIR68_003707 [Amoeboaphelidium protococcarum]|nr:hypothetical protein MIR68_003707 [Amoeboaphelidium protococcarum]
MMTLFQAKRSVSTSMRGLMASLSSVGNPQGKLVLVGSGWGIYNLLKSIDTQNYDVHLVSPKNYFTFTPLLASTSVGTLEFRSAIEPVRVSDRITFHQARCDSIDFQSRSIQCSSALDDSTQSISFDKLVVAVGAQVNTFGIPGVDKYAHFLKDISNARSIRTQIIKNLELASSLQCTTAERKRLCSFVAIGSGPTGVEFVSELYDLISDDVARKYPSLMKDIEISIYDVAPRILPSFDPALSNYTTKLFTERGIKICTGKAVTEVHQKYFKLKDGSEVPYSLMIWSAGLSPVDLIKSIDLPKDRMKRLYTDDNLQVLDAEQQPISGVYALGDCAVIKDNDLPCTAQVARQKGKYLASQLNLKAKALHDQLSPFEYNHRGSMAYVGGHKAVVQMNKGQLQSGTLGWLIWRGAYVGMANSLRNKIKISTYWMLTWLFGREISHFN